MIDFLKKNTEFIESFERKGTLFPITLKYYHFIIGNTHYMLSQDHKGYYVLTDYLEETKDMTKYIATGSANNIKEAIKKLIIKSEVN